MLITQDNIRQVLHWTYERSVNGFTFLDSNADLAAGYAKEKCLANMIAEFSF